MAAGPLWVMCTQPGSLANDDREQPQQDGLTKPQLDHLVGTGEQGGTVRSSAFAVFKSPRRNQASSARSRDQFSRSTHAQTSRNNGRSSMTWAEGISGAEVEC